MAKPDITLDRLKALLLYDPATGLFTWRARTSNRVKVGSTAGRDNGNGYTRISLDGRSYYAHRLAWFYVHGVFPTNVIDHKDGNGFNNAILNLREATQMENGQNMLMSRRHGTSGYCGVSWSKQKRKWEAHITVGYKKRNLGFYSAPEDAARAYLAAKQELHQFQPKPRDLAHA